MSFLSDDDATNNVNDENDFTTLGGKLQRTLAIRTKTLTIGNVKRDYKRKRK